MAASYGTPTPTTLRGAGPTPDCLVDKTALGHVVFDPTPEGMQVMAITFPAAMGAMYAGYFNSVLASKDFEIRSAQQQALSEGIYNKLIATMHQHPRVMLNMTTQNGRNGPKCFNWLDSKYNRSDTNAAVQKLRAIVDLTPFKGDDVDGGIDRLITDNAANDGLVLPDKFLSALIVLKLPSSCDVVAKMQLAKPELPPPEQLQAEILRTMPAVTAERSLYDPSGNAAFAGFATQKERNRWCFNCDSPGHVRRDCAEPAANCDECGAAAGHVTKHCLVVQHDKPIPAVISAERRAKIERLRKDYKIKIAATAQSANVCHDSYDSDEELSWLEQLDKLGMQAAGQ